MASIPSVTETHVGHCVVAVFSGDMDYLTGPMFRTEFLNLVDSGHRYVVLDLAGVSFCDSAGLNALLAARRRAQETGTRLALARVQQRILQLLTLTGVLEILDVYATAEDAVTGLADPLGHDSRNEGNTGTHSWPPSPG